MYHVLAPIDTDERRALAQAQAVRALPAASESVEVTLLHVARDDREDAAVRELDAGDRAIEALTGDRPVAELETATRRGDVAEEILAAADARDADAIVLGGRKRSPMGTLLFGSVSTDVLLNADRPVTVTGESLVAGRDDAPLLGDEQDEPHETPRHREETDVPDRRPPVSEREVDDQRDDVPPEFSDQQRGERQ